jgi:flagellar M-ring protein FliF
MASNDPSNAVAKAKELAGRLTPVQKIALGAVILTVVAGGLVLSRSGTTVTRAPLYTDLSASDASSVVDALESQGVDYELTDAGRTVMVPQDQVYDLRVAMAGQGLPSSNEGYALLDNQGITTSEFRQRIDYQRALEGELEKTLTAMDDVATASVHLALPDQSVFIDEPATPTASVLVSARGVGGITDDEVDAIVHLVASSVKDMKPEGVTVVDADGTVLSSAGVSSGSGSGGGARAKAEADYETRLAAAITALIARTTGPGKVSVSVSADLDLQEKQTTSERYEPNNVDDTGGLVTSESSSSEEYGSGSNSSATGGANGSGTTPGVLGDQTGADGAVTTDTVAGGTTSSGATDYSKADADRNYALDRIVEQTTEVPGTVTHLSVAVLVDESALTQEQADAVEAMVKTAAGIDPNRNDTISVTRLPFDTSGTTAADEAAKTEAAAASKAQMLDMARTIAVLVVILVALFLGYRSAKNARKVTVTPIDIGEITTGPRGAITAGGLDDDDEAEQIDGIDPVVLSLNRPPDKDEVVMNELTIIADRRPQEVANVLKAWLAETKGGRR